ncbi:hypothetical protein EDD11_001270 [Mortierella claussenii]|nr:hypothetical protein EDD11_001270 [Mortierella claussenii]
MTVNPYPVGTTVFAKLKGYPWWPARIENENDLPENVSSKKPKQRPIWPVFFFGSYDYGWFGTSELKTFEPVAAEKAKSSLRKGNALRTALSEALDPSLVSHRVAAVNQDVSDEEEEEEESYKHEAAARKRTATKSKKVAKLEPAEKKRRPSATEDQTAKRKPSKRSASADDNGDEDQSSKAEKHSSATARSRLESDKRSVEEDIIVNDANNGRIRKSEEDAGDSGDHNRAKKKMRSGQPNERLLKLRHKLQKLLLVEGLSEETLIQNLERADPILTEVEAFEIDLQMLKDTKIGRLMKKISALQCSQDPHRIIERSVSLIKQYKGMMERADVLTPQESKVEATEQRPAGIDKVESEDVTPKTSSVPSHALDAPPAPEAVVAAVAAIVETDTLITTDVSTSAGEAATQAIVETTVETITESKQESAA